MGTRYLNEIVATTRHWTKNETFIKASVLTGLMLILDKSYPEKFRAFCESIYAAKGMSDDGADRLLFYRMRSESTESRFVQNPTRREVRAALWVKAWNAYVKRMPMKVLNFNSKQEKFPKLEGI